MHIFLTGEKRIGKTTAIKNYLEIAGLKADGFVTYWESGSEKGTCRTLYLAPFGADPVNDVRYPVVIDKGNGPVFNEETIKIFNTHGSRILRDSGRYDLIIMDELGFLETKAPVFRHAVMERISGDIPVLGVIKGSKTEFLNDVRTHPKVEIRMVTVENRNTVLTDH